MLIIRQGNQHCGVLRALCAATVVLATANAQALQPPARWKGLIDLTIGGANAVDGADFGRVAGLAVDGAGRVFVADRQDEQIRMFSPAGVLVTKIGRSGSGPLEFRKLATIVIGPDQLLWVRDEGNARMQSIDVRRMPATSVKTIPLQQFTAGSQLPITFEADGAIVDESIWFDPQLATFRTLLLHRSGTGEVRRVDTLPIPDGAMAGMHKVVTPQKDAAGKVVGMSERYMFQPYGPMWLRAPGPSGVRADAVGSRYQVAIFGADGKLLRTLRRVVPPVPLSARERHVADSTLKAVQGDLPFGVPSAKPPIIGMTWSQDGQLWVERSTADGRPREADIYDANGRLVAIAEWPRAIDITHRFSVIRGRTVHAIGTDDLDLERVVRLQFR